MKSLLYSFIWIKKRLYAYVVVSNLREMERARAVIYLQQEL